MKKILIIDDSAFQRKILSDIIIKKNIHIIEATNGSEGLKSIESENPDLVILDHNMPEMTGEELLNILSQKKNQIPVIMVTANIQDTTRNKAINLGVKGFLSKPIDEKDLLETIHKIIEI